MSEELRHKYPVWDRFFQLLYHCDDELTSDEEIDEDLKRAGINMEPAYRRLHTMVGAHRARLKFAAAEGTRESISERIREIVAPQITNLRANVQNMIGNLGSQERLAYFHKLEGAASEADLQSLLDDLQKLAAISNLRNDAETQ